MPSSPGFRLPGPLAAVVLVLILSGPVSGLVPLTATAGTPPTTSATPPAAPTPPAQSAQPAQPAPAASTEPAATPGSVPAGTPEAASAQGAVPTPTPTPAPATAPTGFRVTAVEVAAERDAPEACFTFSDRLDKSQRPGYAAKVDVTPRPPALAVVARDNTLCIEGLSHGTDYDIALRQGLPGGGGLLLAADEHHAVTVPNRAPSLAFKGAGTILPRIGPEGLPLRSINVDHAHLRVLRVADRKLVEKIYAGRVGQTLSDWDVSGMVEKAGQTVWQGDLPIAAVRNAPVVTAFPIEAAEGGLARGVYLALAEAGGNDGRASQWFVVSDIGLTSFIGDDGLLVFARSLTSAEPLAGVELHLLARNGKELAQRVTGADGIARFEPEIARKGGDDVAQALFAYGASDDFGFLDLAVAGVDLTDQGGGVHAPAGPLDAFLYTDRGIYRPSESVNLTVLLRNSEAAAVTGQAVTVRLTRPDGFEAEHRELTDAGAGSATARFVLPTTALPGSWVLTAYAHTAPAAADAPHAAPGAANGPSAAPGVADGPMIGRTEFTVHDFTAPRLEFTLSANRPALGDAAAGAGGLPPLGLPPLGLNVDARYLFGTAAAGLPGELSLTIRPAEAPFPSYAGFRFGLAQEKFTPVPTDLPGFTTNASGKAAVDLPAAKLPDSSHPLEAVIRGTVFDVGGRAINRELVLPVRNQPFAIGVRPRFEAGAVPEGATAGFEVIAVAADGTALDRPDLSYELYEEESDFRWFEANGRWDYETVVHDHRVTGGTLAVKAAAPTVLEETVGAGRYRLEVFDAKSGVATSVRFAAGWWITPAAGDRPDKVEVTAARPRYRAGDVARVFIRPPYDSQVLIAIADRSVRKTISRAIPATGAFLDIPVDAAWTAGVTIIATAYAAADDTRKTQPRRAIGLGWLAVDPAPHTLDLKLDAPATIEPRQTVTVGAKVSDAGGAPLPAGTEAYLTLAAVDESVLQLTDQTAPDPVVYYIGQHRLGVELRDIYGRLLEPAAGPSQAAARTTAPDKDKKRLRQVLALPDRDQPVASLFSGIVRVGTDGTAQIPLTLPDFDGRLRLSAVAWTATQIGHAAATMTVRDRIGTSLALPRFLAPGDRAQIAVSLTNQAGAGGDYQVSLQADGALSLADSAPTVIGLKRGHHAAIGHLLVAEHAGSGTLRLEITGPEGFHLVRNRTLVIRAPEALDWRHRTAVVDTNQPIAIPPDLSAGLVPETVTAALTVSPRPEFDLPGLVMTVDRRLRGNAEQQAAGALRLIAGTDAALAIGLDTATALHERTQSALDLLLAQQRADGGFARWSATGDADSYLTAFAADVLDRARRAGFQVPDAALKLSRDWLKHLLDNGWFEDQELPGRAYAILVLARAHLIDLGAVQYFQDNSGAKLPTALASAQIAAAMAALGDGRDATDLLVKVSGDDRTLSLLDLAGLVTLGTESGALGGDRLLALIQRLAARAAPEVRTSTQDRAWLALAANAVTRQGPPPPPARLTEAGQTIDLTHALYRPLDLAKPPALLNAGPGALAQLVTVTGLPSAAPPAVEHGFSISRTLFDMSGKPVRPEAIHQNDLLVVIVEGRSLEPRRQQVTVTDLLPAGLEIETVRLANSPQLGALSWLGELSAARHVEVRSDRFLAAIDLDEAQPGFRVVYLARAATAGDFVHPGVLVEAAGAPDRFARTGSGRIQIHGDKE